MSWVWAGRKLKGCTKPYGIMLGNKSWGKKEEERNVQSNLACPRNHYALWELFSSKWLHICPPMGIGRSIPWFALLACTAFALAVNYLYLSSWVLTLLSFQFPPLSNLGSVSRDVWRWAAAGFNHSSTEGVTHLLHSCPSTLSIFTAMGKCDCIF